MQYIIIDFLLSIMLADTNYHIASHAMPTTRVNCDPMLLKLVGWRCCMCFKWVPYIPRTTGQTPGAEPGPTTR